MSELHKSLSRCDAYPAETSQVEHIETHISHLYLTDNLVYKIKKNVDFGFCNFTNLERRRFYCEEEVSLNRRLAPTCYLGVSTIVRQGDRLFIDQPGEIYEYAVRMRRLPQNLMLSGLLANNSLQLDLATHIETVARNLARFHNNARHIKKSTHNAHKSMITFWRQNFEQTRHCPDSLIRPGSFETIEQIVMQFLDKNVELFNRRQDRGYVRDGHGDLHCEHICLTEPLEIFDCIEFNPDLRYGDILNDIAFLYMDLDFRRRCDLAQRLWQSYQKWIEIGPLAENLLRFYCLYRAWVRAKVHFFQIEATGDADEHRYQSRAYFRLASSYALPQMLLICCGLIGSGKTTLAQDLGAALRAPVLSSDQIRPKARKASANSTYGQGRYSSKARLAVYQMLSEQAENRIQQGSTLILDATCENQPMRRVLRALATRMDIPCYFIETSCDPTLIRARLLERSTDPQKTGGSEAGLQQFESQRLRFEPLNSEVNRIVVDTGQPREYNVNFLLDKLLLTCGSL